LVRYPYQQIHVPGFIGQFHFDQGVSLKNFGFDNFAFAVFDLNLLFFWHHDIKDFVSHVDSVNTLTDAVGNFFFVTTVSVDGVPLAG
jgi:hypothetical protein